MRNAPDNDNNERAIAITLLRDTIARRSLSEIDAVIAKLVDEAIAAPQGQLAADLRAGGDPPAGREAMMIVSV
jgi:hypothetical protein